MDELLDRIKTSVSSLWRQSQRGETLVIDTPFSTIGNDFVSVFLSKKGDWYIASDGGRIDSDDYTEDGPEWPTDVEWQRLFNFYIDRYRIKTTETGNGIKFYYLKTDKPELVPNTVYDLASFISQTVSSAIAHQELRS